MIGQIEEQQNLMAEMILEMQNRDTQLSLMQKENQKLQKLNNELSELLNILPNTEELLSKMEEQKTKIEDVYKRQILNRGLIHNQHLLSCQTDFEFPSEICC